MSALQTLALVAGMSASMVTVVVFIFGRWFKQQEKVSARRDAALAVVVQHFDPESELTKHVGGTLPERVIEIVRALESVGTIVDGELPTRLDRVERHSDRNDQQLDRHEERLDDLEHRISVLERT